MGFFSRKPVPSPPARQDVTKALDALDPADAGRIRSKAHLIEMCAALPTSSTVLALLHAVIEWPADEGLLYVTTKDVVFQSRHSGVTTIPLSAVAGAEVPFRGTLRIAYDPRAPGTYISFRHDRIARRPGDPEGLDFSVTAKPASLQSFCRQLAEVARSA